jgi:hypothetical protein
MPAFEPKKALRTFLSWSLHQDHITWSLQSGSTSSETHHTQGLHSKSKKPNPLAGLSVFVLTTIVPLLTETLPCSGRPHLTVTTPQKLSLFRKETYVDMNVKNTYTSSHQMRPPWTNSLYFLPRELFSWVPGWGSWGFCVHSL